MSKAMLLFLLLRPQEAIGTGAHVMLWFADLSSAGDFVGKSMFTVEHADYGWNRYIMFATHPSQWWLTAYAVFSPAISAYADISELVCHGKFHYPKTLVMIGHYSSLFILACLWPLAKRYSLPWFEIVAMGNNYENENGAKVTMRHHTQPRLWWQRVGSEVSIPNRGELYAAFTSMKLPRFFINGAYNFAAWHPYEAWGPKFFSYCGPEAWSIQDCFKVMWNEQQSMAEHKDANYAVAPAMLAELQNMYKQEYDEGYWLDKTQKHALSYTSTARL